MAPIEGEALVSWVAKLSADLDMGPRLLCRDAFGVDARRDPEWWRRPDADVLERMESWTGVSRLRFIDMTLSDWSATMDDEETDRFCASRWRRPRASPTRPRRLDTCPLCVAEAPRPHLQLIWMLGWTGACPRHGVVLSGTCPSCGHVLRLRGLKDAGPVDLLACGRCAARLAGTGGFVAHPAVLDLQAALIAGKRSGMTIVPGVGALDWPTTMALADVLLAMVWARRTKKQRDYLAPRRRDRLFASIGRDLGMTQGEWERVPWTRNYGGLLLLAWLLRDLEVRLPRAMSTLCTPRLEGLLNPFTDLNDITKERLRTILAAATVKPPKGRRAWKPWLRILPESADDLRERAMHERYKHRRQRLRALAELKDGASVEAVATLVGVTPHSVYRWLHRGVAGGLEAALERPTGKPALTGTQAEALAQWIACDRVHQDRRAIAARAKEAFGIELNLDAASKLLAKHGRAPPGRRRRLWGPKHGPRPRAGSTHHPAPGP
ncbi:MAG: TniQ family protein [Geminicoccaceae bacterium]